MKGWDPEHVQNVYLVTDINEDTVVTTPLLQGLKLKIANRSAKDFTKRHHLYHWWECITLQQDFLS